MLSIRYGALSAIGWMACVVLVLGTGQEVESAVTKQLFVRSWSLPAVLNTTGIRDSFRNGFERIKVQAFDAFARAYNRTYTREELENRLKVFIERFQKIQQWNTDFANGKVSFSMKINHLADRTDDELSSLNGLKTPQSFNNNNRNGQQRLRSTPRSKSLGASSLSDSLPQSVDYRTSECLAPVRNQKDCGCCYAFATVDLISTSSCLEATSLKSYYGALRSPQEIVDCGSRDFQYGIQMSGCNGGWPEGVLKYLQKKGALSTESQYPYMARRGTCKRVNGMSLSASNSGPKYTELYSEADFKQHLAKHGPVVAAIYASNNFQLYDKGIFDDPSCGWRQWNHAVLVVGYGTQAGKDYWLIKNSYDTDWGENGYMRMIRGKSSCKIGKMGWGIPLSSGQSNYDYSSTTARPRQFTPSNTWPFSNFFPY